RNVREQIAFIRGVHSCPGAPLARTEGRISLHRILDRMTDFRISEEHHGSEEDRRYRYEPTFIMRGLAEFHMELEPVPYTGVGRYYLVHMGRLAANYASRLAGAYLLSITAAVAILIPLGGEALLGTQNYFSLKNIIGSAVLVTAGTIVIAVGGIVNI